MKTRIELILNESNLKKVEFARKLNIDPSYIPKLISGKSIPSDRLIKDICYKFNISEEWLRTGEGDMYLPPEDERAAYVSYLLESIDDPIAEAITEFMKVYLDCDSKDKVVLQNFAKKLLNKKK